VKKLTDEAAHAASSVLFCGLYNSSLFNVSIKVIGGL